VLAVSGVSKGSQVSTVRGDQFDVVNMCPRCPVHVLVVSSSVQWYLVMSSGVQWCLRRPVVSRGCKRERMSVGENKNAETVVKFQAAIIAKHARTLACTAMANSGCASGGPSLDGLWEDPLPRPLPKHNVARTLRLMKSLQCSTTCCSSSCIARFGKPMTKLLRQWRQQWDRLPRKAQGQVLLNHYRSLHIASGVSTLESRGVHGPWQPGYQAQGYGSNLAETHTPISDAARLPQSLLSVGWSQTPSYQTSSGRTCTWPHGA